MKNGKLSLQLLNNPDNTKPLLTADNQETKSQQSSNSKKTIIPQQKKQSTKFSWFIYFKLMGYVKKVWKLSTICMIFVLTTGLLLSTLPYIIGMILDRVISAKDSQSQAEISALISSITLLVVLLGIYAIINFLRIITNRLVQQKLSIDMKTSTYSTFMHNDLHFFEKYKSGELISRLGDDINKAKSAVSNDLSFLIRNIGTLVITLIILFVMSWKLTMIMLIILPCQTALTIFYNGKTRILVKQTQNINAEMTSHISQKFSVIQLVKAYNGEQIEIDKYAQINQKLYNNQKKRIMYSAMYYTCSHLLPYIGIVIVLWYGGKLTIEGNSELTSGQLTSFILYCNNITFTISSISSSYSSIINGVFAVEKVFRMLQYQPLVNEKSGESAEITGGIIIDSVRYKYPTSTTEIFHDLSLQIKEGEYVAFVGQSGAGKSTIIKLLQRFYDYEDGHIYFNGQNSKNLNVKSIRSQIGLVNQEAYLFSGTIRENITYGIKQYTQLDMIQAATQARCIQFINNKQLFPQGFQTVMGQRGSNISGGQRQRISIARALMRKPKIIIFDEATSALDSNSENFVQQSIENIAKTMVTVIVIAHRLSTVINANKIFVMKNGKIVEQGNHKELKMRKKYYYQLIQKQLQKHQK